MEQVQGCSVTTEAIPGAVGEIQYANERRLFGSAASLACLKAKLVAMEPAGGRRCVYAISPDPMGTPKSMTDTNCLKHCKLKGKGGKDVLVTEYTVP